MKRFFSVVGAFIIATGMSCALFTGLSFADDLIGPEDEDQSDIDDSEQGNIPELTYVGETHYDQLEGVDFYQLIQATDEEDGDLEISEANTKYELTENAYEAIAEEGYQAYNLHYEVTDADGNTSELTQVIYVKIASGEETDPTPTPSEGDEEGDKKDDEGEEGEGEGSGNNEGGEGEGNGDGEGEGSGDTNPDPTKPDDSHEPGDEQNPTQPDNPEKPGDEQKPGDNDSGDNPSGSDNPSSNNPVKPDDSGNSNDNNNQGDDNTSTNTPSGSDNQTTPTTPGSTDQTGSEKPNGSTNSSNSDLPVTLPNTGGDSIFNKIPKTLLYSLIFGFVVASIVYYRTDRRASASRKSVR